jgi:hypothetical protein
MNGIATDATISMKIVQSCGRMKVVRPAKEAMIETIGAELAGNQVDPVGRDLPMQHEDIPEAEQARGPHRRVDAEKTLHVEAFERCAVEFRFTQ